MSDIFILENMAACKEFVSEHLQKGYNKENFLGVGSFSSNLFNTTKESVRINVTPHFLYEDLINYVMQGYVSIFERDPVLIQVKSHIPLNFISKWLILEQHTSIFSLPARELSKYIDFLKIKSLDKFLQHYFNKMITKINEIKAQINVILIDFDMFKNYVQNFFAWLSQEKYIQDVINFNESFIIKEICFILSQNVFNSKIAIVPSSQDYFKNFINTIKDIKNETNLLQKNIEFKF